MKFFDWFSGVGGIRLGLERAGHACVGACEIDAFARKVYSARFGHAPEFEDIRSVRAAALPAADLWAGGFPCQDLSTAGKRAGLGDRAAPGSTRSGLVWTWLGLVGQVRPKWLLMENVPGLLHSNKGEDFGALLAALDDLGYVGAWRVLDAQNFGVPQRRRRVFVLARDSRTVGPDPSEVLLESEGVRGRASAGLAARPSAPRGASAGPGGVFPIQDMSPIPVVVHETGQGWWKQDFRSGTLRSEGERPSRPSHIVVPFVAATLTSGGHPNSNAPGRRREDDENLVVANTLTARSERAVSQRDGDGTLVAIPLSADAASGRDGVAQNPSMDAAGLIRLRNAGLGVGAPGDPSFTVQAMVPPGVAARSAVRRLTPRECERLQGLPDDWTLIEGASDARRYKAIGNGVAVPVIEWIGRRLQV